MEHRHSAPQANTPDRPDMDGTTAATSSQRVLGAADGVAGVDILYGSEDTIYIGQSSQGAPLYVGQSSNEAPLPVATVAGGGFSGSLRSVPTASEQALNAAFLQGQDRINKRTYRKARKTQPSRREFWLPLEMTPKPIPGGQTVSLFMQTRDELLAVSMDAKVPWGDSYDGTPFRKGTAQRAIADKAADIFKIPALADIGGFFYKTTCARDRVSCHLHHSGSLGNSVINFFSETAVFVSLHGFDRIRSHLVLKMQLSPDNSICFCRARWDGLTLLDHLYQGPEVQCGEM